MKLGPSARRPRTIQRLLLPSRSYICPLVLDVIPSSRRGGNISDQQLILRFNQFRMDTFFFLRLESLGCDSNTNANMLVYKVTWRSNHAAVQFLLHPKKYGNRWIWILIPKCTYSRYLLKIPGYATFLEYWLRLDPEYLETFAEWPIPKKSLTE
jgi:hypothetical protein